MLTFYLLFSQGIGFGTPFEREKQYEQYRVHKAYEAVQEYTYKKHFATSDTALVAKKKRPVSRKLKNKYASTMPLLPDTTFY